jgi:hypothetical protein
MFGCDFPKLLTTFGDLWQLPGFDGFATPP